MYRKNYERRKTLEHCELYSQTLDGFIQIRSTKYKDPYMFKYKNIYYDMETLEPMFNEKVSEKEKEEMLSFINSPNKHGSKSLIKYVAMSIWKSFQDAKLPLPQRQDLD